MRCDSRGDSEPTDGTIPAQNVTLDELRARLLPCEEDATIYSYVVRSVYLDRVDGTFKQRGSGPNFAGGCITLCTCMHQMRTYMAPAQWTKFWVAGFTSCQRSRGFGHRNWLVYLMQVGEAYPSHRDLYWAWREDGRSLLLKAKAAHLSRVGDIFFPKARNVRPHAVSAYRAPQVKHAHRPTEHDDTWHEDINYSRHGRHAALLVGSPKHSYMWNRQLVFRASRRPLSRGNPKFLLSSFLIDLESA